MTRLIGYLANQSDRLPCALIAEGDALQPLAPLRSDGWGVGSYQGGEVLLRRKPADPREELRLMDLVRDLRTPCAVIHVRNATVGPRTLENTHPFRYRQWVFAHHGTLPDFVSQRRAILDGLPEFLGRSVRGDTDSEAIFYRFLAAVHETGRLDDPEFDRIGIVAALQQTVTALDTLCGTGTATLNLAVTNGYAMVVLRRGFPMSWVRRHGIRDCALCRKPSDTPGRASRSTHHEAFRYVLVSSQDGIVMPGWQEVPESPLGTCVAIDRQLDVQVVSL